MEDIPDLALYLHLSIITFFNELSLEAIISLAIIVLLLLSSAMVSGSEVAFFSLKTKHIDLIKDKKTSNSKRLLGLLERPKRLLATILIANNFLNIAIIILSTYVSRTLFDFSDYPILGFILQVIVITFIILLFAEVIPKIYAAQYPIRFAGFMTAPLVFCRKMFYPFSSLLVKSTNFIDKKLAKKNQTISMKDLSHALEIAADEKTSKDDKKILEGIVQFSNFYAREIMKPRLDVVSVDINTPFNDLLKIIAGAGYSRIPVYKENFDNVTGILYIKDLLPYLDNNKDVEWQKFLRNCFFVPESKKISDLLKEFQDKKIHLAVVVDEYGGTSGIITLEDIIEEIIGEIVDEFDIEEIIFSKIDDSNYVFEGKTLLNDFCKITGIKYEEFENIKGEADTLAGLILEIKKELPHRGEKIEFKNMEFVVEAVDQKRIKRIKVKIK